MKETGAGKPENRILLEDQISTKTITLTNREQAGTKTGACLEYLIICTSVQSDEHASVNKISGLLKAPDAGPSTGWQAGVYLGNRLSDITGTTPQGDIIN